MFIVLHEKLIELQSDLFAEDEGFEPPELLHPLVFKTSAIDHSANLPIETVSITVSEANSDSLYRFKRNDFVVLSGFEPPTPKLSV